MFDLVQPFSRTVPVQRRHLSIGVGRAKGEVVETQRTRTDIESDLSGPFISICAGFFYG